MRKTMRGMKKAGMSGTMFDREAAMAKVWGWVWNSCGG